MSKEAKVVTTYDTIAKFAAGTGIALVGVAVAVLVNGQDIAAASGWGVAAVGMASVGFSWISFKRALRRGSNNFLVTEFGARDDLKTDGLSLNNFSDKLKRNKGVVLTAVRQNGQALEFAGLNLRNNAEVVQAAVDQDHDALKHALKDAVLGIVILDGLDLAYASGELKKNPEVVKAAVNQNPKALQYASKDAVSGIIRGDVTKLKYASHAYQKQSIEDGIDNIRHVSSDLRKSIIDGIMEQLNSGDSVDTPWKDSKHSIDRLVRVMDDINVYEEISKTKRGGVYYYKREYLDKWNQQTWGDWGMRGLRSMGKGVVSAGKAAANSGIAQVMVEAAKEVVKDKAINLFVAGAPSKQADTKPPSSESKSEGTNKP